MVYGRADNGQISAHSLLPAAFEHPCRFLPRIIGRHGKQEGYHARLDRRPKEASGPFGRRQPAPQRGEEERQRRGDTGREQHRYGTGETGGQRVHPVIAAESDINRGTEPGRHPDRGKPDPGPEPPVGPADGRIYQKTGGNRQGQPEAEQWLLIQVNLWKQRNRV